MPRPIRVARASDGSLTYAVPMAPQSLPPVPPRALLDAWDTAREAIRAADRRRARHPGFDPLWPDASLSSWAPPRRLVFRPAGGEPTELAIADRDAGAWADAIDCAYGLENLRGMTLCLRLLALVEALARLPWLAPMFTIRASGIQLDPALLAAAASMPLDGAARFDEGGLKRILSRPLPSMPHRSLPGGRPTA